MEIDWDKVFQVIADSPCADWDKEIVGGMVLEAHKHWTVKDEETALVRLVEVFVEQPFVGRMDLVLEGPQVKLVEWKTTKGKLDERWEERVTRSWQMRLYASKLKKHLPIIGEVRGVRNDEKPSCKTVSFLITRDDAYAALTQIRMCEAIQDALKGEKRWIRNPIGCRAFGPMYPCEFEEICWGNTPAPTEFIPEKPLALSHSSMCELLRCPERRRLMLCLKRKDDDEKTAVGTAFHAAMAEIYKQIKEKQGENNEEQTESAIDSGSDCVRG